MDVNSIRTVIFARDQKKVAAFYAEVLGMTQESSDQGHTLLMRSGFELIVHQIPQQFAAGIEIEQPPKRRENGAIRLDFSVENIQSIRVLAKSLGGDIDDRPPAWADQGADFYLGFDPEGNVFGVSQKP